MAARNISFNGNTLQTANTIVTDIDDAGAPTRDLSVYKLGHANGSKIPYDQYSSRNITIMGSIYGDSITDLDARIDTFKSYFNGIDKNLDIDFSNTTRRYIATMSSINIHRPGGLAYATFEVNFVCSNPFGRATTASTLANYTQRQLFTTNPSFSSNTTGWAGYNFGSITRTSVAGNGDGTAGFAVQVTATGGSNQGITTSAIKTLTSSATYTYSAYINAAVGVTVIIQVDIYNAGAAYQRSVNASVAGTGGWQRASVTFTLSATETGVNLVTYTANTTVYYMDLVLLETGSSPTTYFDSSARTTTTATDSFTFAGTAPLQQPIITMQQTAGTLGAGTINVGNNSTGQQITVTRTWAVNDILIVDCAAKAVYVNGVEFDFVGAFPEFPPGTGVIGYSDSIGTAGGRTYTYKVEYYPQYL